MAQYCTNCGTQLLTNANFCKKCGTEVRHKQKSAPSGRVIHQNVSKRERIISKNKQGFKLSNSAYFIIAIIIIGGISYFTLYSSKGNPIIKNQAQVLEEVSYPSISTTMYNIASVVRDGKVIIPLDVVKEKKFVAFNYEGKYSVVPLLAYISEEGKLVTAISMCEPCNSKSFHIKEDEIICNSCGTTWKLNNLEAVSGACGKYPPDPLPSVVVGNEIQIDEARVVNWTRRI